MSTRKHSFIFRFPCESYICWQSFLIFLGTSLVHGHYMEVWRGLFLPPNSSATWLITFRLCEVLSVMTNFMCCGISFSEYSWQHETDRIFIVHISRSFRLSCLSVKIPKIGRHLCTSLSLKDWTTYEPTPLIQDPSFEYVIVIGNTNCIFIMR